MKKYFGFTLAELLVAMAMLGVIAALTIPVLSKSSSPDNNAMMMKKVFNAFSEAVEELINSPSYPGYDGVCPSDEEMDTFGFGCMTGSGSNSNTAKLPCLFTQLINTKEHYNVTTGSDGVVSCPYTVNGTSHDLDIVDDLVSEGTTVTDDYYKIVSVDKVEWYFPKTNGYGRASSSVTAQQARDSSIVVVVDVNGEKAPNCVPTQIGSVAGCNDESVDRMRFRLWAEGQVEVLDDVIITKLDAGHISRGQD